MEKTKGIFSYYEGTLKEFLDEAIDTRDRLIKCAVSHASQRLVKDLARCNIVLDDSWHHTVDNSGVRHIIKTHGNNNEELRGQSPLDLSDLIMIPLIVNSYDTIATSKNKRDQDTIMYTKTLESGDTLFYVEEVRQGRHELAASTLYKRKKENSPTLID